MPPYAPIHKTGPVRAEFIRQLKDRWSPSLKIDIPKKAYHDAVTKMFDFKPLVEITPKEKKLLAQRCEFDLAERWNEWGKTAESIAKGEAEISTHLYDKKVLSKEEAVALFSDGSLLNHAIEYTSYSRGGITDGCRGLEGYRKGGIDVLSDASGLFFRKGKISVLDVGSSHGLMLFELGKEMKGKVETHALSPLDEPTYDVDFSHFLTGECLPREFGDKFDLIVSNRALEYALFAHRALESVVAALSEGGKARLQWYTDRFNSRDMLMLSGASDFFSGYVQDIDIDSALRAIWKCNEFVVGNGREAPRFYPTGLKAHQKEIMNLISGTERLDMQMAIAWCAGVGKLMSMPGLTVTINGSEYNDAGWVPVRILIEKH